MKLKTMAARKALLGTHESPSLVHRKGLLGTHESPSLVDRKGLPGTHESPSLAARRVAGAALIGVRGVIADGAGRAGVTAGNALSPMERFD